MIYCHPTWNKKGSRVLFLLKSVFFKNLELAHLFWFSESKRHFHLNVNVLKWQYHEKKYTNNMLTFKQN